MVKNGKNEKSKFVTTFKCRMCQVKPISMVSYPYIPGPHRLRGTVETFLIKK
jgi:hypothetical protein